MNHEDECLDAFAYHLLEHRRALQKTHDDLQTRHVEIMKTLGYIHGFKSAVSCLGSSRFREKIHRIYKKFMKVMDERKSGIRCSS